MTMRLNEARIKLGIDALRRVLPLNHPADAGLKVFFRDHPKIGKSDRAFVAETVFGILRHKRFLEYLLDRAIPGGKRATPREMLLAFLTRVEGLNLRELRPFLSESEAKWVGEVKAVSADELPLGVEAEMPDWLLERLRGQMGDEQILELARSLKQPAPLDLRVNTLKGNRLEAIERLKQDGIDAEATRYSPFGIRLRDKFALNEHPLFQSGVLEVQDEGSQLLGMLLAPKRREMVVDFCAGAGGKTLLIGALMNSQGRIYALDISEKRLNNLKPRLARSGLSNVNPQLISNENDLKVKRLAGKIDRVLVDAPCSGLGTLRRNPDLKWRQSPESIAELTVKQAAILNAAARLLKPGGTLVYATCSFLNEENRQIVEQFLETHPDYELKNAAEILASQGVELDTGAYLELLPQLHGTDGFFAAALAKKMAG